ncbi:MAG: ABC transporter permease [Firmicutes bacterium]|nr:ABC transporter permease [Bacillota bacterium]
MNLPLHLATRFLKSGKTQTFVIVLGIAVGVSVQVFIGSLITGLQKSLVSKTIGSSSQITISAPAGSYIDGYDAVVGELQTIDQIKVFSPTLDARGTLISGAETQPTTLRGFDFSKANQIYGFDKKLTEGVLPKNLYRRRLLRYEGERPE